VTSTVTTKHDCHKQPHTDRFRRFRASSRAVQTAPVQTEATMPHATQIYAVQRLYIQPWLSHGLRCRMQLEDGTAAKQIEVCTNSPDSQRACGAVCNWKTALPPSCLKAVRTALIHREPAAPYATGRRHCRQAAPL
jgi:hypothetical protein